MSDFINAIKNINFTAIKLLFTGKIKELISYIDLYFLLQVFTGVLIAFFTYCFSFKIFISALSYLHLGIFLWLNNWIIMVNY